MSTGERCQQAEIADFQFSVSRNPTDGDLCCGRVNEARSESLQCCAGPCIVPFSIRRRFSEDSLRGPADHYLTTPSQPARSHHRILSDSASQLIQLLFHCPEFWSPGGGLRKVSADGIHIFSSMRKNQRSWRNSLPI